jgi:hypothetical protein
VGLKLLPSEILKKIENSETVLTGRKTYVYKCHGRFREGITSVYDDERTGPPTSTVTVGNIALVKELRGHRFETSLELRTRARKIVLKFVIIGCNYFEKLNRTLDFDV